MLRSATAQRPTSDALAQQAYLRAVEHLRARQQSNGALAGEVVWNPMLVCQYVIVCHIVGHGIPAERRARIRRSLEIQCHPDGGWGMLPVMQTADGPQFQGGAWLFHTTLGYVALRLLGIERTDPLCARALQWIRSHQGVYTLPAWGRAWLAMLGLYPWHGVQPIVPELWLMPDSSPMHPRRFYCHMRLIYLGLSYVYGSRFVAPMDQSVAAIRRELYPEGYDESAFERHRDRVAATDLYEAPSKGLKLAFRLLRKLERFTPGRLRQRALDRAMEHILFEFRSTKHVCLSPVNGLLFTLALFIKDPCSPEIPKALAGLEYWAWEDEEQGLRFCGARSDIWDTSFTICALTEGPSNPVGDAVVRDAATWLAAAQIQTEIPNGQAHYREPAFGGWGFANEHHPWPVSDCTAEALEALIHAEKHEVSNPAGRLSLQRKLDAVEFVLRRQNDDGGFGSYESRRGSMALRRYNPAEIYGNCMLEYSYSECTGSCVRGLSVALRELGSDVPAELSIRTRDAIDRGSRFLLGEQHAAGGWLGFWGVNITYGSFFSAGGLLAGGLSRNHPSMHGVARWLVEAQRSDGGWAENFVGMLEGRDVQESPEVPSSITQTGWALLALLDVAPHERAAIERGIALLIAKQQSDGSWLPEAPTGCFFNTAILDYELYRQVFPAWALARYLGKREHDA